MVNKILILAISFVVISSNFQAVSAEIFFPSTNVRLDGPSEYCIISPKDELVENKKTEWIRLTENAVLDWEENLKNKEEDRFVKHVCEEQIKILSNIEGGE